MIAKEKDFADLRKAGKMLAHVLRELVVMTKVGVTTAELDLAAERMIKEFDAVPVFLGYKPEGSPTPYPASLCVSINDEVVHGIPHETVVIQDGDVVSLDLGLSYNGYFVDAARTVAVGEVDSAAQLLLIATKEALDAAIKAAKVGGYTGDIGAATVEVATKYKLGIVEDLGGHAVGRAVHEKPFIANDGVAGEGDKLLEGHVLAIEPMLCEGRGAIILDRDQWTYRMEDGKRAAHFEDTVILTKNGPEILTR
ncbi:MAG: type I methionyl aminopeptidase [Patescibacteria group bacterium]